MNRDFSLNHNRMDVCVLNVRSGTSVGMESTNTIVLFLNVKLLLF